VTLRNSNDDILVHETDLAGHDLVKASRPVQFVPGVYTVVVADSSGNRVLGQWRVVDPTMSPADLPSSALAPGQIDVAYQYEAYLRVLPEAAQAPDSQAGHIAAQFCHQSP
jgi:hypothetical protein